MVQDDPSNHEGSIPLFPDLPTREAITKFGSCRVPGSGALPRESAPAVSYIFLYYSSSADVLTVPVGPSETCSGGDGAHYNT